MKHEKNFIRRKDAGKIREKESLPNMTRPGLMQTFCYLTVYSFLEFGVDFVGFDGVFLILQTLFFGFGLDLHNFSADFEGFEGIFNFRGQVRHTID